MPNTFRAVKNAVLSRMYRKADQVLWLSLVGLLALLFGVIGFSDRDGVPSLEPFFDAVGFLTLNNFSVKPNGCLIVARLLSVFVFGATTFALIYHYVGNDIILWRKKGHSVVVGAGAKGHKILEGLLSAGDPLVVIEKNVDPGFARWCRINKIGLVHGDATEKENLILASVHKAKKVYIFCGDDETSLQVASLLGDDYPAKGAAAEALPCFVELASQRNFGALSLAVKATDPAGAKERHARRRVEPRLVNIENITARELFVAHPIDRFEKFGWQPAIAHVIVLGDTPMVREIIRQAMQQGLYEEGRHLQITVLTPGPRASARSFVQRYPAFREHAASAGCYKVQPADAWVADEKILPSVTFHPLPAFEELLALPRRGQGGCQQLITDIISAIPEPQAVSVFVATGPTSRNVNFASCIAEPLARLNAKPEYDAALYVHVSARAPNFTSNLEASLKKAAGIACHVFEDFMGDYSPQNVEGQNVDELARHIMNDYNAKQQKGAADDEDLKQKWNAISEEERDSNRQAAAHAEVKWNIQQRSGLSIHALAQIEHRRWCAEKLLKGFSPLIILPSTGAVDAPGFHLPSEDAQRVIDWFNWDALTEKAKAAWRSQKLHLDLVPFSAIRPLIQATGHPKSGSEADREVCKDHEQIDFICRLARKPNGERRFVTPKFQ